MQLLIASIIAAFAMGLSVYNVSSSIMLAIIAYALTGTIVMLAALVSAAEEERRTEAHFS